MENIFGREEITKEELFYLDFDWFIAHVRSLAMDPVACCRSQGNYNVAHELFYILSGHTQLLDDPLAIVTQHQKEEVQAFIHGVKSIPENARCWTTVDATSVENMRHAAWEDVREHAQRLLTVLAPILKLRNEYYAKGASWSF